MQSNGFRRSAIALAIVALAGCSTWDSMTHTGQATTVGATSGAVGGAVVGGPVGAVAGAAIGGVAGHEMAKSEDSSTRATSNTNATGATAPSIAGTAESKPTQSNSATTSATNAEPNTKMPQNATNSSGNTEASAPMGSAAANTANAAGTLPREEYLRKVQQSLNDQGYDAGKVDGKWGPHTAAALKKFQGDHGLDATGEIDAQTITALGITQPAPSATTGSAESSKVASTNSSSSSSSSAQ